MSSPDGVHSEEVVLQAISVVCERGLRPLFAPVSFALQRGELLEVRGANGIGKTTLLRTLAGLSRPARGYVARGLTAELPSMTGFIGHAIALHPQLTVIENLSFWLTLDGLSSGAINCEGALKRAGLWSVRSFPASRLSQGQRRRVALARISATPRALWVLDEPDAGLDRAGLELLRSLLAEHNDHGGAAVIATHLPEPLGLRVRILPVSPTS